MLRQLAAEVAEHDISFSPNVHVALKIRSALANPDCHIDEAVRLVQAEPVLSARTVAMANSVAYNRSGREIADVRTAVSRLGFQVLRNLAMALVVRQMAQVQGSAVERELAARLWEYTAHVTALARLIAREVTGQDPEAAAFAAIVHDLGGFYLLARAKDYPGLLDGGFDSDELTIEIDLTRRLLKLMAVPSTIVAAIEDFWNGELNSPPHTLGDTLLLAAHLAPVRPPLHGVAGSGRGLLDQIDHAMAGDAQEAIVAEAGDEVRRLRELVEDAQEELRALLAVMQY